jgi:hypothetical protein
LHVSFSPICMTVSFLSIGMFWLAVELGYLLLIHSCEFSVIKCNHFYFYVEIIDSCWLIDCLIFVVISIPFVLNMRLSISKGEGVQTRASLCLYSYLNLIFFLHVPCVL